MAFYYDNNGELMSEYCRKHNLCYSVVRRQMVTGISFDDAVKHARDCKGKRGWNNAKYFYKGKSLRSICKNKTEYEHICNYIRKNGCSVEKAVLVNKNVR